MSTHVARLLEYAEQVKAERETESLADAQAALDKAQARYDNDGGKSAAYNVTSAKFRVVAAEARSTK